MEIRQLEALVGIADNRSFSTTAEALETVQSNISTRIARLEAELGAVLVHRGSGELTEAGILAVARARRIIDDVRAIATDVISLEDDIRGHVAVGMIGTTGRWLIPILLKEQRVQYPHIQIRIVEGTNSTLEPQLASGKLDLAILSQPIDSSDLTDEDLFTEDLVLVVARDHPLALLRTPLQLSDIAEFDLLLPSQGTALRSEIDDAATAANIRLRPLIEIDGIRTLASLAFDGHGAAILPATALSSHLRGAFVAIPISDLSQRRVALVNRRYGFPSTPVRAIRSLLVTLTTTSSELPSGVHIHLPQG